MRVAGPNQRATDKHWDVQRRPLDEIAVVDIARKWTWRHRVVPARLGTCDTERPWKRPQRNFDAGSEFSYLTLEVDVKVFDLTVRELLRELAEHAWNIEVCPHGRGTIF